MKDVGSKVYNNVCITMTFMFGVIIGALIHTDNSLWNVLASIGLATVVFHFTIIKNFNFIKLRNTTKKGS
jgi:hypothetical protein